MWMKALTVASIAALTGLTGTGEIPLGAQGAQKPAAAAPAPPPGGDVKTVLHDWANHMGMLRELAEHDLIATLEYLGTGTINTGGQPCTLTRAPRHHQLSDDRDACGDCLHSC